MAGANVATNLKPLGGEVLAPGAWPLLEGYVTHPTLPHTSLQPYARLWGEYDELIWIRPMVPIGVGYEAFFRYQTLGPGATETKRIAFGAGVSGGSWALGHHDVATDWIYWGDSYETIRDKIAAHPDFHPWHISVIYDGPGRYYDITFASDRAGINIDDISVISQLTGSGDLSVSVSTPVAGTGDFSTHAGGRGHYFWDIVTWDGTTWTGGSYGQRGALAPARAEFWIDATPAVNALIDGGGGAFDPVENVEVEIASSQPHFSWTIPAIDAPGIAEQTLVLVDHDTQTVIPTLEGTDRWRRPGDHRDFRVPYGVIPSVNGTKVDWQLNIIKRSGATASLTGRLEVQQYLPPAPANITFVPYRDADGAPIYYSLNFTVATDDEFLDTVFRMREAWTVSRSREDVVLGYRSDPLTTGVNIVEYPLNVPMILSLSQRAMRNGRIVEGPAAEVPFTATWDGVMLTEVYSASIRTLSLPYHDGRSIRGAQKKTYAQVLNRAAPIAVHSGVGKSKLGDINAVLHGPFPETARTKFRTAWSMYVDEGQNTLLYRDTLGEMIYCAMDEPVLTVAGGGRAPRLAVPLTEIARDALQLPTGPAS